MLRVIVTYDIQEDRLRKKVSDCCLDYGLDRQQFSVFTGVLKPVQVKGLAKALRPFVKVGHVLIIPIGADDWERRVEIGQGLLDDD